MSGPQPLQTSPKELRRIIAMSFLPLYAWIREAAAQRSWAQVVVAVTLRIVFSAMVYAPTATCLTELFPPRNRCTGLSVSYHLGAGVFGGFTLVRAMWKQLGTPGRADSPAPAPTG